MRISIDEARASARSGRAARSAVVRTAVAADAAGARRGARLAGRVAGSVHALPGALPWHTVAQEPGAAIGSGRARRLERRAKGRRETAVRASVARRTDPRTTAGRCSARLVVSGARASICARELAGEARRRVPADGSVAAGRAGIGQAARGSQSYASGSDQAGQAGSAVRVRKAGSSSAALVLELAGLTLGKAAGRPWVVANGTARRSASEAARNAGAVELTDGHSALAAVLRRVDFSTVVEHQRSTNVAGSVAGGAVVAASGPAGDAARGRGRTAALAIHLTGILRRPAPGGRRADRRSRTEISTEARATVAG
jgi:hypothetical protein